MSKEKNTAQGTGKHTLQLLYLYPDVMSLYGEYANIAILRKHLEAMDISVSLRTLSFDDTPDFTGADFIYMGAGTERAQKEVAAKLVPYKDAFVTAINGGAVVLFTGAAMELLGRSVVDVQDNITPCLGLADYYSVESDKRDPVDVVAETELLGRPVVGFMNKCSVTKAVDTPLFEKVTLGFGNEGEHGPEGFVQGNVFATHLTGPLLVKNPAFLDLIIERLFARKGWEVPEDLPILPYEREAYTVTLTELTARIGHHGK